MPRKTNSTGRNKTRPFVMLRHDISDSFAWKSLSPVARCIWLEIMRRYNGNNNGNIPLSCLEAAKLIGVGKNTAHKGFKALVAAGFIKVAIPSGFSMKMRRATRWTITHERLGNEPPSAEWRKRSAELSKSKYGPVLIPSQSCDRDDGTVQTDNSPV